MPSSGVGFNRWCAGKFFWAQSKIGFNLFTNQPLLFNYDYVV